MQSPYTKPAPTLAELDAVADNACEIREAANAAALSHAGFPVRFHPQAAAILDAVSRATRAAIDRYLDAANAAAILAPAPEPAKPHNLLPPNFFSDLATAKDLGPAVAAMEKAIEYLKTRHPAPEPAQPAKPRASRTRKPKAQP